MQCYDGKESSRRNWLDFGWYFKSNIYNGLIYFSTPIKIHGLHLLLFSLLVMEKIVYNSIKLHASWVDDFVLLISLIFFNSKSCLILDWHFFLFHCLFNLICIFYLFFIYKIEFNDFLFISPFLSMLFKGQVVFIHFQKSF